MDHKDHKQAKHKNKFLKLLPNAVNFQNPPFSPGKDRRRSDNIHACRFKVHHAGKGFSVPMTSMIPAEARRRERNGSFHASEPTSPKISCIGQIKQKKKKMNKKKSRSLPKDIKPLILKSDSSSHSKEVKKDSSKLKRIFASALMQARKKVEASDNQGTRAVLPEYHEAPSLSQMKRFASGRESLANFDRKIQLVTKEIEQRNYYSDEEKAREDEEDEDEYRIPFSAPLVVGGEGLLPLEPRKEINLWKRRTMAPPRRLDIDCHC